MLFRSGPGLVAAAITLTNMGFAWKFLTESNELAGKKSGERPVPRKSRDAVRRVVSHSGEPASRLIWIYGITMGSFQGMNTILALFLSWRFGVTEDTIGYFFMYVGTISFVTRAAFLGKMVDKFGEPRLSRIGMVCLAAGLGGMAAAPTIPLLAAAVFFVPLGAAFTFPCVTGLLSRVVPQHERGLYMGVQQTFGGVGRFIGPLYAGFAFDHLGKTVPYYTAAVIVLATISLGVGIEKSIPPKAPPKPAAA